MVWICYLDEAGGLEPLDGPQTHPVFVLAGVALPADQLGPFTARWIDLKAELHPRWAETRHRLDLLHREVKGKELRRLVRGADRGRQRWALRLLDRSCRLLTDHGARILGRVYIKARGARFVRRAVYTSAVQGLAEAFQQLLAPWRARGVMVLDSRQRREDVNVSHSLFTQRLAAAGDPYPSLVESPLFADSRCHAGLQLADLLASGLLWPMAIDGYCRDLHGNEHVSLGYGVLRERYGPGLRRLAYPVRSRKGRRRLSVVVADPVARRGLGPLLGRP